MLRGQVGCGNEPGGWGGRIVKGVEVAGLSANLPGQPGRGTGVGQVAGDDVRGCPGTGQILRQTVKWLRAASLQRDGLTLSRVAAGDRLAKAGSGSEHSDGFGHKNAPMGSSAMHETSIARQLGSASETACSIQPVEGCGVQLQFGRGQDLVELGDAARTRDRDDRRLAVQQPREHDLVRRGASSAATSRSVASLAWLAACW